MQKLSSDLYRRLFSASVVAAVLLASSSCGGGGGGGGAVQAVPPAVREASFAAINARFATLAHTDPAADGAAMAAFMAARPEFVATGTSADGSAWGRFTDGRSIVVLDNRPTGTGSIAGGHSGSRSSSQGLTNSITGHALLSMGSAFDQNYAGVIAGWLSDVGYADLYGQGSYDEMFNVSGDGVFYIDTHGGYFKGSNGASKFAMWTSTPWTRAADSFPDVISGDAVYMSAVTDNNGTGGTTVETHLAITPGFVRKHWHFAPNSFVYIDACDSADAGMAAACISVGAAVYAGWSNPVRDNDAGNTSQFLFDRLCDRHAFPPVTDPTFPPQSCIEALALTTAAGYGVSTTQTGPAHLVFTYTNAAAQNDGILPLVNTANGDDATHLLTITGVFGPNQGRVMAGSTSLAIHSWSQTRIVSAEPSDCSALKVVQDSRESVVFSAQCGGGNGLETGSYFVDTTDTFPSYYTGGPPWRTTAVFAFAFVNGATHYHIQAYGGFGYIGTNTSYDYTVGTGGHAGEMRDEVRHVWKPWLLRGNGIYIGVMGDSHGTGFNGIDQFIQELQREGQGLVLDISYH